MSWCHFWRGPPLSSFPYNPWLKPLNAQTDHEKTQVLSVVDLAQSQADMKSSTLLLSSGCVCACCTGEIQLYPRASAPRFEQHLTYEMQNWNAIYCIQLSDLMVMNGDQCCFFSVIQPWLLTPFSIFQQLKRAPWCWQGSTRHSHSMTNARTKKKSMTRK